MNQEEARINELTSDEHEAKQTKPTFKQKVKAYTAVARLLSQKVLFVALSVMIFLVAIILSPVLIFGPRLACKTKIGRDLLLPKVKIDPKRGFGLAAPNLIRKILTTFTIPLDGVCKAIYTAFTGKQVFWLYEPIQMEVQLPSPRMWEGRNASDEEIRKYLEARRMTMAMMITAAGYRSMCWTRIAEFPQRYAPNSTDCFYTFGMF